MGDKDRLRFFVKLRICKYIINILVQISAFPRKKGSAPKSSGRNYKIRWYIR